MINIYLGTNGNTIENDNYQKIKTERKKLAVPVHNIVVIVK
ncbi:hypothetical protein [Ginsengibacter hankyongi]|nr:hypothetical protein [Ginsengibacter hankyongi]